MWLETERLILRDFTEQDEQALFPILSDPEVMRYLEPPYSSEQTRVFLREAGLCTPPLVYALVWKASGELIGHVIWHPCGDGAMELGWVLRRGFWGRGIAGEISAALLAQTDRDVLIECLPEQAASRRIAERLGFCFVGVTGGLCVYKLCK